MEAISTSLSADEIVAAIKSAQVIQFEKDANYVIVIDRAALPQAVIDKLSPVLHKVFGVKAVILAVHGNPNEALAALRLQ